MVGCCDLLSLKILVWDKLRDYVMSRVHPNPKLILVPYTSGDDLVKESGSSV